MFCALSSELLFYSPQFNFATRQFHLTTILGVISTNATICWLQKWQCVSLTAREQEVAGWKCFIEEIGARCATMLGTCVMQMLCAVCWASQVPQLLIQVLSSDLGKVAYTLVVLNVEGMKRTSHSALTKITATVLTQKTQVLYAEEHLTHNQEYHVSNHAFIV